MTIAHKEDAEAACEESDFAEAGRYYTLAAYDALRGLARECIGDLEVVRGNETAATEAYDAASTRYETVSETGWLQETGFEWAFEFFREVSDAAGKPLSVDTQIALLDSFDDRLNAKREGLPEAIETVTETGDYSPGS